MLRAREKDEFITARLYADPHRVVFKYFSKLEKLLMKERFERGSPFQSYTSLEKIQIRKDFIQKGQVSLIESKAFSIREAEMSYEDVDQLE